MNSEYLSPSQFARQANLTLHYVYALLYAGRLAAEKRDGRWAINQSELERRSQRELVISEEQGTPRRCRKPRS